MLKRWTDLRLNSPYLGLCLEAVILFTTFLSTLIPFLMESIHLILLSTLWLTVFSSLIFMLALSDTLLLKRIKLYR